MQQAIEGFGLSLQQARIWTLQQEQDVYRSQCAIRIKGSLHLPTLRESVQRVLTRHEVYRASFRQVLGMKLPLQVVHPSPLWLWQCVDLGCLSPQWQHEQQERLAQDIFALPLDWERGPLVVCTLLTLAPEDHLLLMHLPTLLADAASLNLFFQELSTSYPYSRPASAAEWEDLPYLQFSEMQTALLEERNEQEIRHRLSWWEQIGSTLTDLTLPCERKETQPIDISPRMVTVSLAPEEIAHFQAFLQEQSCSWPAFLLASFQLLLYRLTGRTDLLLGVEIDGRSFEDLAELSGLLSKELPLFCRLDADLSLAELMEQTEEAYQDLLSQYPAFSWEDMERVTPLRYPYSFAFREQPQVSQEAGVCWTLQHVQAYGEPFKVKLIAVRAEDTLDIEMHYDSNRFNPYEIERLAKQFTSLLTQAIRQPEADLAALEMLGDAEREYLLVTWNQTQQAYPEGQCVHQLIEQQVQRTPDAVAVYSAQGQLTYQALDERANQLAHALRSRGVQPEVLVGLCLPREPECLIAILGILKAGGAYLPLEADQPPQRLAGMLEEAKPVLLLTTSARQHLMPPSLPLLLLDTEASMLAQYPAEVAPKSQIEPENLAYVLYTSGSTGKPKGVMISQEGLLQYVYWATRRYEVADGEGCPLHSSLAFDLTVTSLFAPLVVGRAVSLVGEEQGIQGLADALRQKQDFSLVKLTPTHLELLSQMLAPAELVGKTRMLIVGGEALRWEHVARWHEHAPETRIINEYGPTETVVGCCVYEVPADAPTGAVPIGRPIVNTQLYVLDAHLRPVPVGVTGEIFIGGIGVARGYLQRGDLTAERFLPNPFGGQPGARLYRTGDLGRHRGDGELEYLGRIDQQVKVRGYRVELGEIEAVLMQHAGVREAVVQVRRSTGGEAELVGYVLTVAGLQSVVLEELRGYLGERLPRYMVPTSFVVLQAWPLTRNGKVDRQALLAMESTREEASVVEEVPRTGIQEVIAGLWCSVLDRAHVGLWENFFDLGGHSLLATRLISRLKAVMGVEVPVHVIFDQPTVAGLAQWVELALRKSKGLDIPPIGAVARPEAIPMSFAQQRLWFLDQLEPASTTYLLPRAFRLHGTLDIRSFEQSFQALIYRHESLRTTFEEHDGHPVQVIHPLGCTGLSVIDLQGISQEKQEQQAQRLAEEEAHHPCDLAKGPLLRTSLILLARQEHIVLLTLHHIITDGWSTEVLIRELIRLYQAFVAGQPSPLSSLPLQYADYALWQREFLQGEVLERQLAYWRTRLAGMSPLALPTDHPRPPIMTSHGARQSVLLSQALLEGLQTLSRQESVTLFITLLTAFQVLLARYSGESDIAVGTPIANRTQAEIEGVIGFFVNTLVMRTDLSGHPTFGEVLKKVREVCLGAYTHQDIPFEKVVEELEPQRDLSHSPLFQVMFVWQQAERVREELAGISVTPLTVPTATATKFDLTLSLAETEVGLHAMLEYRVDLFEAETILRLLANFQTLLEGIVQNPQARISDLPLLTEAELHKLLVEWNTTSGFQPAAHAEYPQDLCMHQLFELQVKQTPDAVALVCEDEILTYGQLSRRANQLAHYLQTLGVGPEVVVGICLPRSLQLGVGLLAILKAGGAYLPLDPIYPPERLAFMLEHSQVPVLITNHDLRTSVPSESASLVIVDIDALPLAQPHAINPQTSVTANNLAYIIYTSGSTGRPKGVSITHATLLNLVFWHQQAFNVTCSDRATQLASPAFDAMGWEVWPYLALGASVSFLADEEIRITPSLLCDWLTRHAITITFLPTALAENVLDQQWPSATALRFLLTGADALHRYPAPGLPFALINNYGPTEATVVATAGLVLPREHEVVPPAIGGPITNTQVYILDKHLQPTPIGTPGELYIGGAGLARGYSKDAEQSAEKFLPNPFVGIVPYVAPGARLYRTGDLVRYRPDGAIEYLGRIDQQVKLRGYRIELGEIEAVLREHPNVQECAVVLREDEPGEKRLVAYLVVPAEHQQDKPDSHVGPVRSYLQGRLPAYMIPAAFVVLSALPLSPNGKLDRRALPPPDWERSPSDEAFDQSRNAQELALVTLWAEVLRLKHVGIRDNFFALGGDSILSLQIIARAKQRGLHFTLKQLFQYQTIEQLSQVVQTETNTLAEQGLVLGSVPLTPIQSWFFDLHLSAPHHWNQALFLQVAPQMHSTFFQELVHTWLTQHDALRLRFRLEEGEWRQVLSAPDPLTVPFAVIDLNELDDETQERTVPQRAAEAQASLDLTEGPLLRVILFKRGRGQTNLLLIVIHHLAVDGVSWRILLEDLQIAAEQVGRGQAIALPAKTSSFQAWADHLVQYAGGSEMREEQTYWLTRPMTVVGSLPRDFSDDRAMQTVASTRLVSLRLSSEETSALLQVVPTAYHTQINEVLLTALAQVVTEWTGSSSMLVELEGHGREDLFADLDVSRTIGWFTSMFPVYLDLAGTANVVEALKGVKEQLRAIPSHGIGYGLLRYLCPDLTVRERLNVQPAAELAFNYLGQFDQTPSPTGAQTHQLQLGWSPFSAGSAHHLQDRRTHLLGVTGQISQGQLVITWSYSQQVHRSETIQGLANRFGEVLRQLIDQAQVDTVASLTPSDFPLASLDQSQLDQILQQVGNGVQIEDLYPLSPMQEGLLFHTLYAPGSGVYVIQTPWQINGPFQVSSMQRALQQVIERHAVLRTRFLWQGLPQPLQIVQPQVPLPWISYDWQALSEQEQQVRLERLLQEDRERGFDLSTAPLLRLTLVRLCPEVSYLLLSSHHILLDGWSRPLLLAELRACYQADCQGEEARLAPVPPYRDYVAWLQKLDRGQAEQFWRAYLAGFTTPNRLPSQTWAPSRVRGKYVTERLACSPELSASLREVAGRWQVTFNTLLQGVWAILLSRYCGQTDVVFGATTSGRSPELLGMETMIGLFINTLPVRVQVRPEVALSQWLRQLQREQTEARQYEATPLVQIQSWSQIPKGEDLFESLLIYQNYPHGVSPIEAQSELAIQQLPTIEQTHYPLMLTLAPGEQTLGVAIQYAETHFEASFIAQMLQHLHVLLQAMVAEPEQRLGDLPWLTRMELHQLLADWNATDRDTSPELHVHQLFEQQVAHTPETIAMIFEDEQVTYSALHRRTDQLAQHLRHLGVAPGVLVGICMQRSIEMVVSLLAILKAGGAYVPLDPAAPASRLAFLLQDSQVQLVLTQPHLREQVATGEARCIAITDALWEDGAVPQTPLHPLDVGGEQVAYMIYTSGSTGQPKGVLIPHRAVINVFASMARCPGMTAQDRVLAVTAYSFDIAALELLLPLTLGASIYLASQEQLREGSALVNLLEASGATLVQATPSLWRLLLLTGWTGQTGLKVWCGGEALPSELAEELQAWGEQVWNLYGPTETTIWSSADEVEKGVSAISIGRPIDNTRMYVLDEAGQMVPIGVVGELYIAGLGVGHGYWQRAELTAERFVPDPWSPQPGGRLYRTGDRVCRTAEGKLQYVGRRDQQVKLRGHRIELGEIETVLRGHESVQEGVVMVREDDPGDPYLVAYLVPKPGENLAGSVLRAYLQERLPTPLIPATFVELSALPLTPNGKIDRRALPRPGEMRLERNVAIVPPRTPAEEVIAEIWSDILRVEQVGVYDNFFELGGHSLRAVQVISRLCQIFQVELSLQSLFERPTIADLVNTIAQLRGGHEIVEEIALIFKDIEQLSKDDIENMLYK